MQYPIISYARKVALEYTMYMLQGINHQDIFENDEDYRRFITTIRSVVTPQMDILRQICLKGVKLR